MQYDTCPVTNALAKIFYIVEVTFWKSLAILIPSIPLAMSGRSRQLGKSGDELLQREHHLF